MARMRKRGSHAAQVRPARPDQDGTGPPPAANPPAGPASDGTGTGAWPPGWAVTSPPPNGSANGVAEHGVAEHGVAEHGVAEHPVAEHGRPGNGLVGRGTRRS